MGHKQSLWQSRVSRRGFLQGAGAGLATLMVGDSIVSYFSSKAYAAGKWDREADVIVVGSGAAAFAGAVSARQAGSSAIIIEKAPIVGGTTAKSGGAYWIPNNRIMREAGLTDTREDALKFMARHSYPQMYHPDAERYGLPEHEYNLIAAFYDNGAKAIDFYEEIGALKSTHGGTAMFPDYLEHVPENKAPRGRSLNPRNADGSAGSGVTLIQQMREWSEANGVPILTNHRAERLVVNEAGEVIGLEATTGGQTVTFRAKRGVIFGSGGFTHNPQLMLHYQKGPTYGGCAVPTCEGDLVAMGGAIGAKMGNMNSAWNGQVVIEQALQFSSVPNLVWQPPADSMVMVNRYGKRVTNEKRNYNDRTKVHYQWDPVRAEWPNQLLFMVYDQRAADTFGGAYPLPAPGTTAPYVVTADTLDELGDALEARLESLGAQIGSFKLDETFADNLKETVARFNEFAEKGVDEDFDRGKHPYDQEWFGIFSAPAADNWPEPDQKNVTMYPLQSDGPYHAIILGAGTLDTNGGPMTDTNARILDTDHEPIPGLYGAGNCVASPSGSAYYGGGTTLGAALTFGYLAGQHAAKDPVKKVDAK